MSFHKMSTDEKVQKPFEKVESTPQPHFIPGYTGFCPDLPQVVGASYARVTNEILQKRPEIAGRLGPTEHKLAHPEKVHETAVKALDSERQLIKERRPGEGRKVLNDYMMPGYCGHVPNISDAVGVNFSKGCVTSISKFIRQQAEEKEGKSLQ